MDSPIKVMVVDDSAVVRQSLGIIIKSDPQLLLVGAHSNPKFAMKAMEELWPDVVVLDIEMPEMDGITFLKSLMKTHPIPVIICSTLTTKGAAISLEAMSSGAVEVIEKPKMGLKNHLEQSAKSIIQSIKTASQANVKKAFRTNHNSPDITRLQKEASTLSLTSSANTLSQTTDRIIAIGTSTGGTQALEYLLSQLPVTVPGILIVQHMPEAFTKAFADRLNSISKLTIKEAVHNERILSGHAYIANGGKHLEVRRVGAYYYAVLRDGPLVSRHKPSVNVLFNSVAEHAGKNAVGIILTGMGDDGAKGLYQMKQCGAVTYAQDEKSCVVFGMPKEAIRLDPTIKIMPLDQILNEVSKMVFQ